MLPMALDKGEGSETRAPLALAVMGGLFTSTLLTLVLIPVLYHYLMSAEAWIREKRARRGASA